MQQHISTSRRSVSWVISATSLPHTWYRHKGAAFLPVCEEQLYGDGVRLHSITWWSQTFPLISASIFALCLHPAIHIPVKWCFSHGFQDLLSVSLQFFTAATHFPSLFFFSPFLIRDLRFVHVPIQFNFPFFSFLSSSTLKRIGYVLPFPTTIFSLWSEE